VAIPSSRLAPAMATCEVLRLWRVATSAVACALRTKRHRVRTKKTSCAVRTLRIPVQIRFPPAEAAINFSSRFSRVASCLALINHQHILFRYEGGCAWKNVHAALFFLSRPA